MKLKDLLEKRARTIQDMRAISDHPEGEGGDLSDAQAQRFDQLKGELENAEKAIQRQQLLDEAERRMQGEPISGSGDGRLQQEYSKFSILKAIAGQVPGLNVDDGRERELSKEQEHRSGRKAQGIMVPMEVFQVPVEERTITTAAPAGGPGSNIIATDYLGHQFIDILRAKLIVRRLGARVLNGLVGNVDIPRLKASATAGWVAEDSALSPSDAEFSKVQLSPKHAGAITELSRNMLQQSSPDVEQLVRMDFAAILAAAVDGVAIKGGGSNEPSGILETSGIGAVDMSGGVSWAKVLELIEAVEEDDAQGSGFCSNPHVIRLLRSTPKEVDGSSVAVSADYIMEGPRNLAGYPCAVSTLVPNNLTDGGDPAAYDRSALIYGNWSDLLVGYWSAFDLLVNPFESTAYSKGNVLVRGMLSMDVAVRHPESFAAATKIATSA